MASGTSPGPSRKPLVGPLERPWTFKRFKASKLGLDPGFLLRLICQLSRFSNGCWQGLSDYYSFFSVFCHVPYGAENDLNNDIKPLLWRHTIPLKPLFLPKHSWTNLCAFLFKNFTDNPCLCPWMKSREVPCKYMIKRRMYSISAICWRVMSNSELLNCGFIA